MNKSAKRFSPWKLAAYLLCIALLVPSSFTLAQWRSSTEGFSSTQVAVFAADAASTASGDLSIDSDSKEASYTFTVANHKDGTISQVDIAYTVMVALPQALPEGLSMTVDGIAGTVSADGLIHTFTDSGWTFPAGTAQISDHTLTFTASDALSGNSALSKIAVTVEIAQID